MVRTQPTTSSSQAMEGASPEELEVVESADARLAALEAIVAEQSILIEKISSLENKAADSQAVAPSGNPPKITLSGGSSACDALLGVCFSPASSDALHGIQFALMALLAEPIGETGWRRRLPVLSIILGLMPFIVFVVQFTLLVLVTEAGTSSACDAEKQEGCHLGEYCSLAFANGQCNDCSLLLDDHFGPPLAAYCSQVGYDFRNASDPLAFTHPLTNVTYSGSCKMYGACTQGDRKDIDINRCDFLVAARADIKVHHFLITCIGVSARHGLKLHWPCEWVAARAACAAHGRGACLSPLTNVCACPACDRPCWRATLSWRTWTNATPTWPATCGHVTARPASLVPRCRGA
jgi:hypothetical protein